VSSNQVKKRSPSCSFCLLAVAISLLTRAGP
jgi:hypothetical protein